MHLRTVEKLHIAIEQLEDALAAYFAGRFYSAIVLAGAAEQLFAGYLHKYGETPAWPHERRATTKIANGLREAGEEPTSEKAIGDLMNFAYNNAKHAGASGHSVVIDPKFEANVLIDRAISNYDRLDALGVDGIREISLAQRFIQTSAEGATIESDGAG